MPKILVVNVGSNNPAKIKAVEHAFRKFFDEIEVHGFEVDSKVSHQPKSMQEIVTGTKNRAIAAYKKQKCDYSIGIEAGIFEFPGRTGYVDNCISIIHDGEEFYYGGSPIFEYPKFIVEKIFKEGKEVGHILDDHLNRKNVKHDEGAIGWLSKNKMKRQEYVELSVFMALVSLVNKELY